MAGEPQTPVQRELKQPDFKFRTKPVAERSVWESWAVLPAKTRLRISLAITAFAAMGIVVSNQLEKAIPAPKDSTIDKTSKPPAPSASS